MQDIGMKNVYCQTQEPRDICAVKVTEMRKPSNSPLSKDLKIPHRKTPPPSNYISFVWKEESASLTNTRRQHFILWAMPTLNRQLEDDYFLNPCRIFVFH